MYYWTALLEEEPESAEAGEAVACLKSSLGELHQLVNRAFELMRPVEARPIQVGASDLAKSIALRLGVELAALLCSTSSPAIDHVPINTQLLSKSDGTEIFPASSTKPP